MANTKELKERIGGVQETQKITNAMYLIASTKLRRARIELQETRPYFDALRTEIVRLFRVGARIESRYLFDADGSLPEGGVPGILVITADKGLAGSYNQNVVRRAEELLRQKSGARLFIVGEYGWRYFSQHGYTMEHSFHYGAPSPTMDRARELCTRLLELYDRRELSEILVVYTDMKTSLSSDALTHRLLPLERGRYETAAAQKNAAEEKRERFEFIPSAQAVLDNVMRSYIAGFLYAALLDSFCSEQNARVSAMDAANRNAEELLSGLRLQLNRERQAAITQEITEISAGAKAQSRKHQKNNAKGG